MSRQQGWSRKRLGRLHDVLAGHVEHGGVPGLVAVVGRGGETHVEAIGRLSLGASKPVRRDTIFRIASQLLLHILGQTKYDLAIRKIFSARLFFF